MKQIKQSFLTGLTQRLLLQNPLNFIQDKRQKAPGQVPVFYPDPPAIPAGFFGSCSGNTPICSGTLRETFGKMAFSSGNLRKTFGSSRTPVEELRVIPAGNVQVICLLSRICLPSGCLVPCRPAGDKPFIHSLTGNSRKFRGKLRQFTAKILDSFRLYPCLYRCG